MEPQRTTIGARTQKDKQEQMSKPDAQVLEPFLSEKKPYPSCHLSCHPHQVPARWRFMDWVRR